MQDNGMAKNTAKQDQFSVKFQKKNRRGVLLLRKRAENLANCPINELDQIFDTFIKTGSDKMGTVHNPDNDFVYAYVNTFKVGPPKG